MKRFVSITMAAAMTLGLLAGCGGGAAPTPGDGAEPAPAARAITVILNDVGNNLDPSVANAITTSTIMSHVYDKVRRHAFTKGIAMPAGMRRGGKLGSDLFVFEIDGIVAGNRFLILVTESEMLIDITFQAEIDIMAGRVEENVSQIRTSRTAEMSV